ncbi:MAG: hypothetical protein IPL52_01620 [Flavobacteriales bacterium]|nr:hypothetical protein [Flavobacteriales bacterium]
MISGWKEEEAKYSGEFYTYLVRGKEIKVPNHTESLSHLKIPKVALPKFRSWGDKVRWAMQENTPGFFPYTAGIYPFKRQGEDPARMFAGEGGPERTNKRFHYVSQGLPAKRLSTAFDSVTLYGHDPGRRPDIYGKVGNSGVSICCLDDAKKLYSGFDLTAPTTSVSMTINGPAPMLLGFFMNAAIDQNCEKWIRANGEEERVVKKVREVWEAKGATPPTYLGEVPKGNDGLGLMLLGLTGDQVLPADVYAKIKADTLAQVRGTVQADILKEDQAQNTCIFSTEFALRLMGDVQQYFIEQKVRNFYSVSISGYHIAEAGANPISQLAFTLANGFTYVEYYLSRGMDINAFAPNLSFFFSNGMDPEYAVMGRVARRLWAKASSTATAPTSAARCSSTTSRPAAAASTRRRSTSTTSAPRCRRSTPSTTTATACTPTPTTRPSPRPPRKACAAPWPSSSSSTKSSAWPRTRTRCKAPSSSKSSPTWWKRPCSPSSTASPNAAACSAPWRPCTSAAASRRKASTTKRSSTPANTRSSV